MLALKSIALVLILCFAADALRLGDIPDVIVGQIRKHLNPALHQPHDPAQQKQHQQHHQQPKTETEQTHPHHPDDAHHRHQEHPTQHHKPHTEIIDEKERIYVVPKKDQNGKKLDDKVVVLEKEIIRRVVDDGDKKKLNDDDLYDEKEHEGHFGQSIFSELKHERDDEGEFCGGPADEAELEPEIIHEVNNFDAIADAILERRFGKNQHMNEMEDDDDDLEDDQPQRSNEGKKTTGHRHHRQQQHQGDNKKIVSPPKPSHLTADEAKLWNSKLNAALKNRHPAEQSKEQKFVNHLLEDLKL